MTTPAADSPASALRVLVVDDDPRVRAGLSGVLRATPGLAVAVSTGSAIRALAVATRGDADVALVDALLPGLADGVQLVHRLTAHLPVVAISLDGSSRGPMLAAGAVAFVEKDGSLEGLLRALAECGLRRTPSTGEINRCHHRQD